MPKSNYPNKLDTSVEIPVVRDNITEIGSDVLNGLRSAIFNIERALGINPHGAVGGTVSSRMSRSLDDTGNIKKEALDRANVLSGPLSDPDVSLTAAIKESKLSLDFPTQLLQDEISYISAQIDDIINKIQELNAIVATHIHPDATGSHKASAISVESSPSNASDISTSSLDTNNLQETLRILYNNHINYTGLNISETNNSHSANQIYYDNEDTKGVLSDIDVQSAITSLSMLGAQGIRDFVLNLSSNGIIRTGSVSNQYLQSDLGEVIIDETPITYFYNFDSTTSIMIPEHPIPNESISEFDVLTISNATNSDDDGDYKIKSVTFNASLEVTNIEIYGILNSDSESGTIGVVTKNIYSPYNENGLNCVVRPRSLKTNTPDVQVANPNSATIISLRISPQSLTVDNHVFSISIDSGDFIDIETYDETANEQTLSSVIHKINTQFVRMHLNCLAYRLRVGMCYELAISHNIPNMGNDLKRRTITVKSADFLDGLALLGMLGLNEVEHVGRASNAYHINGYIHSDFGRIQVLTSDDLTMTLGTTRLSFVSETGALEYDIRVGDILVIDGSSESSDDGTYRIKTITESSIYVDDSSVAFSGELESDTSVAYIIRCTIPVGEMTFTEAVLPDGSILFDGFLDEEKNVFFKKRMEVDGDLVTTGFVVGVVDVSRNFIKTDEEATLKVYLDSTMDLEDPLGMVGPKVFAGSSGEYKVYSADGLSYIVVHVHTTSAPLTEMTVTLHGFDEIMSGALWLCRGMFSNSLGYVIGHVDGDRWVPTVIDKRATGTVDDTIISENILERYIQGPRNELRGSGVIRGLEITNHVSHADLLGDGVTIDSYHTVDISAGVAVVSGIRIEFVGANSYRVNLTDDFYIAMDPYGCIIYADAGIGHVEFPFKDVNVALLAHVDISEFLVTDLRLFVDHIDYKYLGDVTVSNDQRFSHFTNIHKAVDYARMFSKIFPDMGTPTIFVKEGEYEIEETIFLDFDLTFRGAGPQTVLKRSADFGLGAASPTGVANELIVLGAMHDGSGTHSEDGIIGGITLRDFSYYGISGQPAGGDCVINIRHDTLTNPDSHFFVIKGIRFIAADDYLLDLNPLTSVPNEMPIHIGIIDGGQFENILIEGCYFDGMGYMEGVVYLNSDNDYRNINVVGNISRRTINPAFGIIITSAAGITMSGVQEVSNVIDYV
jgi:hypothetical protein